MQDRFDEYAIKWKETNRDKRTAKRSRPKRKKETELSDAELRQLMGSGKQRLHRGKGGAFKR